MSELIIDLPAGNGDFTVNSFAGDLAPVKVISPAIGLVSNAAQITGYGADRVSGNFKSYQLGVMPVSPGIAKQYLLSKQAFAPECNQTPGIQIAWMY